MADPNFAANFLLTIQIATAALCIFAIEAVLTLMIALKKSKRKKRPRRVDLGEL